MSDRIKILIVDDEVGFTRLLKANLDETGLYDVKIENYGQKGLKTARSFRPDVILMDITMPDMSGIEVALALRADPAFKQTPIIYVTATQQSSVDSDAVQAFAHISKPTSAQEIIECVKKCTINKKGKSTVTKESKHAEEVKIKILVLDDDKTILNAFSCLIQSLSHGYDVEFFSNAQMALQAVTQRSGEFKLIMTDIRMPGMDGITFAEAVRTQQPELPIIFMTAYVSEDFSRRVEQLKKAIYLEKPFHLESVLRETIPDLLRS